MYTNELLEEKYKTQKDIVQEAEVSGKDYLDFIESLERAISFEKQPRRGEIVIVKTLNYHKAPAERYI